MIAFGPVPSRRLGYSLGINHIPVKHCTYACVYCQVGRTSHMGLRRQTFYPVSQIVHEVETKISKYSKSGNEINYLTLVPDGEPTLDLNLGKLIEKLKQFRIPIAVISNASLIDRIDIQDELLLADWVSLKVDSVVEPVWRKINRPNLQLNLENILTGILAFRNRYKGEVVTETMLVAGVNDDESVTHQLCDFLLNLQPFKSYLSIPTRPPAQAWATPPSLESLSKIIKFCYDQVPFIDLLFESEVGEFASTGNLKEDILGITAVHPIREEALRDMIARTNGTWLALEELLTSGQLGCILYLHEKVYLRNFQHSSNAKT